MLQPCSQHSLLDDIVSAPLLSLLPGQLLQPQGSGGLLPAHGLAYSPVAGSAAADAELLEEAISVGTGQDEEEAAERLAALAGQQGHSSGAPLLGFF
jgi:hypothetical protein